ncbi:hypothetical protein BPAE_0001g00970 [Botrytis paeoniae]|uniref:Uncharacterized protein n=1 Tax=Botrytis paeoniae TaxID=278948 RepID=A0A4Z1G709_9HELO|nr:hypothetical protein BPAE_0001g00970 [Botrytis paeoniae]
MIWMLVLEMLIKGKYLNNCMPRVNEVPKERSRYHYDGYDQASSFMTPVASLTNPFPAYIEETPALAEKAASVNASECFNSDIK